MRAKLLLAAAVSASLLLSACGNRGDSGANDHAHDWTALTSTLDSYLGTDDNQVEGYSFALKLDGKTVYTRAAGDVSGTNLPMTLDLAIPIASASKALSATIILSLVKDGLIDLDVPVAQYIGSQIDWPSDKSSITMRMLLNHTSGIPFTSPCLDKDNTTLADCAQEIADTDLNFTPGLQFGYSGADYQVAGYIATVVSGKSWATLVNERLAGPLGMGSLTYGDTDNPRIAGGAWSTAEDYLKFTQLYLDGGKIDGTRIISASQVNTAKIDQVKDLPVYFSPEPEGSGLNGYSFGWWISDADLHPGSAGPEISDPGLFGTTPWIDFDKHYTAIVLINGTPEVGYAMFNAARTEILQQLNAD